MTATIKQNTPEWLEMRKSHIGASDAPIVMGISPWKTPYQLWEEKLGLSKQPAQNFAMKRGHELEPKALQAYNDYTGNFCAPEVVFHQERKYMMSSLDGLSLDRSMVVEIKCPGKRDHDIAANGEIPEKYYPQLQHQLATIGLNMLHYFSYSGDSYHLIEVPRDDDYIENLYKIEGEFWDNLKTFESPALTDKDYLQKDDAVWAEHAKAFSDVNSQMKALKVKEKECRDLLINLSDGRNCIGGGVKLQKILRKGSVDYKSITELGGVDLEQYRKSPVTSWRFS